MMLEHRELFVAFVLMSLSTTGAAAQQLQPSNMLTASGFVAKFPKTPEERAHLESLPANKLVTRTRSGKTYYVYADPAGCNCAYVGTPQAYANYQNGGIEQTCGGDQRGSSAQELLGNADDNLPTEPGAPNAMDYIFGSEF